MSEKTTHTNPDPLYENLRTHFGFSTFKGNQEAVIRLPSVANVYSLLM